MKFPAAQSSAPFPANENFAVSSSCTSTFKSNGKRFATLLMKQLIDQLMHHVTSTCIHNWLTGSFEWAFSALENRNYWIKNKPALEVPILTFSANFWAFRVGEGETKFCISSHLPSFRQALLLLRRAVEAHVTHVNDALDHLSTALLLSALFKDVCILCRLRGMMSLQQAP